MIRSFTNSDTQEIFQGQFVKGVDGQIQQRAREKLKYLDSAMDLRDLLIPPSNMLEGGSQGSIQHQDQQAVASLLQVEGQ